MALARSCVSVGCLALSMAAAKCLARLANADRCVFNRRPSHAPSPQVQDHHELRADLPQGAQPRQGHRQNQAVAAQGLACVIQPGPWATASYGRTLGELGQARWLAASLQVSMYIDTHPNGAGSELACPAFGARQNQRSSSTAIMVGSACLAPAAAWRLLLPKACSCCPRLEMWLAAAAAATPPCWGASSLEWTYRQQQHKSPPHASWRICYTHPLKLVV